MIPGAGRLTRMTSQTITLLNRINAHFYDLAHQEFSASRNAAWEGWRRLLDELLSLHMAVPEPFRVLDAGCGNARFARFLDSQAGFPVAYTGVDASRPLLAAAASMNPPRTARGTRRFIPWDMVAEPMPLVLRHSSFDLVVLFGVMHHIPSKANRVRLLTELASTLIPERGLLAVTFWRFAGNPRFQRRMAAWDEIDFLPAPIDPADLEPDDYLLRWGAAEEKRFRYCHHVGPIEAAELLQRADLVPLCEFQADGKDGRSNHYVVARVR